MHSFLDAQQGSTRSEICPNGENPKLLFIGNTTVGTADQVLIPVSSTGRVQYWTYLRSNLMRRWHAFGLTGYDIRLIPGKGRTSHLRYPKVPLRGLEEKTFGRDVGHCVA